MTSSLSVAGARLALPRAFELALVQCLFLLGWIVYAVYLGDLLEGMGWPRAWAPRLLLVDQLLFACADVALGFYADRIQRHFGRIAPLVLSLNLLSCVAFVALPHVTGAGPGLFLTVTAVWLVTSSVLRAPLYGLIARHAAGQGNAALLLGLGVAGALAPYLGVALKGVDPVLPFTVSGVALALATLTLSRAEAAFPPPPAPSSPMPAFRGAGLLSLTVLCLGAAFQVHFFVNAAPLFKTVAEAAWLPWLMPVFWMGFSLAVYPGAHLAERASPRAVLAGSAALGALTAGVLLLQPPLTLMLAAQFAAGAAWGGVFIAALNLAGGYGHSGRESTFVGLLFASMAMAAVARIGLSWTGAAPPLTDTLWLSAGLWALGAGLALRVLRDPARAS